MTSSDTRKPLEGSGVKDGASPDAVDDIARYHATIAANWKTKYARDDKDCRGFTGR